MSVAIASRANPTGTRHRAYNVPENYTQGPIAVDEGDTSSDYGSSLESDMTSLKSSIMNYVFENGRRYHAYNSGKYILPNDEAEQDRLDLHHHLYLLLLDGMLTMAPLEGNIQRVLDVGTGTGIWAVDCADQYPTAEIIGTDLSPIQPSWVPPNCRFEVDDAEQDWLWPTDHFDFIHSRNLTQSIRNWPKLIQSIFKHTKPGGYVEIIENEPHVRCDDGTLSDNSNIQQLMRIWRDAAKETGLPQPTGEELKGYLDEAGFTEIQFHTIKQPYGVWPRDEKMKSIGRCHLLLSEKGFHAYSVALLTRSGKMTAEKAIELCDGCVKEVFNKKIHSYTNVWYVVGRKPETA